MSDSWRAEIHVWPHSTERGNETDQREAGDRVRFIEVTAHSIREALFIVEHYRDGIMTNPMVWQAPIVKLEKLA